MSGADDEAWVTERDGTMRPTRTPGTAGDALRALVARRRWGGRLEGATVFSRWESLVGPELARRCEPVTLAGGLLVVRAENQAWATEVRYLGAIIRERADEVLRPGLVREVKVTVGPLQGTTETRPR